MNKRTSVFENSLIWFGAAVSIAEILTGTYFASLGFFKGLSAIVLGHIVGCVLFVMHYLGLFMRPIFWAMSLSCSPNS